MNELVNSIFWGLIFQGILLILFGILLFVKPEFLGILVAAFLVAAGVIAIIWAFKTRSSIK